ncbi:MAG: 16S rRNA (adenine(1518)-N(6)/adenine(1519)-N(6))-dimethyltransferase RsmA [Patescibacteria group bacterium]
MDISAKTKELCRLYQIKPSRSKGQNFLINEAVYEEIIRSADLKKTDEILEVGPGLGFLTARLAAKSKKVSAVELDDKLASFLQAGLSAQEVKNVQVINTDILQFDEAQLGQPYKIVANLPYNISSFFLRKFLSTDFRPELMVLLLQKEVAERIVAWPGKMSLLAVSVQYYAQAEIIKIVPPGDFWPAPQVESAIIKIKPNPDGLKYKNRAQVDAFFRLVKMGFSAKRKMLKNNLAAGLKLEAKNLEEVLVFKGFNPKARAEDLSVADWQKLFAALAPFML